MLLAALVAFIAIAVAVVALLTFFANRDAFDDVSDGDAQEEVVDQVGLPDQFAIAFMEAAGGESDDEGDEEAAEETADEDSEETPEEGVRQEAWFYVDEAVMGDWANYLLVKTEGWTPSPGIETTEMDPRDLTPQTTYEQLDEMIPGTIEPFEIVLDVEDPSGLEGYTSSTATFVLRYGKLVYLQTEDADPLPIAE
jgi:hypothetical protein